MCPPGLRRRPRSSFYSTMLRSLTQGRGTYSMEPANYEPVPPNIADKVLEDMKED